MTKPLIILILLCAFGLTAAAQAKKKNIKPKKAVPVVAATPQPTPEVVVETPVKKNQRPDDANVGIGDAKADALTTKAYTPVYFYKFERPGFIYSPLFIEHDESGAGQISFKKDGSEELYTDPLQLSPGTLANLKAAFTALAFLDSTVNYQFAAHDFSNMGNITITLKRDGRSREAKFNWTENKNARVLMDEYRRVSNEYTWKFEFTIARENQPLLTPGLMDTLDGYLTRSELTDPPHLTAFLTELSTDERLPLIARNHAAKLIQKIEKPKK